MATSHNVSKYKLHRYVADIDFNTWESVSNQMPCPIQGFAGRVNRGGAPAGMAQALHRWNNILMALNAMLKKRTAAGHISFRPLD